MSEMALKNIVILGGGTAGWMVANFINKKWQHLGVQVTLIESPDIGIIGVGEGSTPSFKFFLDALGIAESEWMPECNATYKVGISFKDWSRVSGYEQYFHPFRTSLDFATMGFHSKFTKLRRQGLDVSAHPNRFYLMASLARNRLAPLPSDNFPFHFQYGYHFDSVLIGKYLRKRGRANGVKFIEATVDDVKLKPNGDIESLNLNNGQSCAADYFFDCTGFASVLLQKTLQVPFVSFAENLFNDAAIAVPTAIEPDVPCETISTALSSGWVWKIPLTNRFGNGYVYSSKYLAADAAETELRTHLGILESDVETRHLKMRVGRVTETWRRNCVGIGLAQGFIEPLEATAIQFVYTTIDEFIKAFEEGGFSDKFRNDFNQRMNRNYEGIRDYIVLHYKTNSRTDSQYWIDNRENKHISDNLRHMLESWYNNQDTETELKRLDIGRFYSQVSWNCLLSGMGVFPPQASLAPAAEKNPQADLDYVDNFIKGCAMNFQPHQQILAGIKGQV